MENSLQAVTETSAIQLKTALPALLNNIRLNGARNLAESSLAAVDESLQTMVKDPVLSKFPFDQASFGEIVYRVIKSGTVLERAALARHLSPSMTNFFPSVKTQIGSSFEALQISIDQIIKPMFLLLADHFGVPFNGDIDSVSYSVLTEFGGLTFADFLIFTERAKTGRYRQEFQHVATRGINADFLISWLEQYVQEKTEDVDEVYRKYKNPTANTLPDQDFGRKLETYRIEREALQAARSELLRRAQDMRVEFESELYETTVVTQWFKFEEIEVPKVDDSGPVFDALGNPVRVKVKRESICSADDPNRNRSESLPFRIPKEGSIERLLKKAIFEFVTFGKSKKTEELFDDYKTRTVNKYKDEPNPSDLVLAEFKICLSQVSRLKAALRVDAIIEKTLEPQLEKMKSKPSPKQISDYVFQTVKGFEDSYFDEYLPRCFDIDCPPMTKDEFVLSSVLEISVHVGGVNPFNTIFE